MYTNINSTSPLKHDIPMIDGCLRLHPARAGGGGHALHAGRRDGAGDDGGRGGAVHRRGAVGDRALPVRRPGLRLRDRHLHLECGHEIRRAGLRHARIHARHADDRADGAVLRAADARLGRLRGQRARRAGDVGDLEQPLVGGAVGHEHGLSRGRLAGGRADREPREVRHGLRGDPDDPALFEPAICATGPTRSRWRRSARWAERAFLRHPAHAGPLYDRLLPALPQRLAQLRGLGSGGRGLDAERAHGSSSGSSRSSSRRRWISAVREALADFVERRKAEGGAPTDF
jgi:hypothetical protein